MAEQNTPAELELLEKLDTITEKLGNKNLAESEKKNLETETKSILEKLNAELSASEKGLFWVTYTDKNKTLHYDKNSIETLESLGFKLAEKDAKNKYIGYNRNSIKYNMLEKIFTSNKDLFIEKQVITE